MPEEERLIAELVECDELRLAAQSALTDPGKSVLFDEYRQLAKAATFARGKVAGVRVRLRSLRTAKLRKKDSHQLHELQNALNGLAEEIDTITYDGEVGKEQAPSPDVTAAYQERNLRLEAIREKLAGLTLVMDSVDGKLRSSSQADATSAIGEAVQRLDGAELSLQDVETHLNNAEGARAGDENEIASARSSADNVNDDLKAAKAALQKL